MVENSYEGVPLSTLWASLMARLAVCTGALAALTSIWNDVPLLQACLRGGLGWFVVLAIGKGFAALAERTAPADDDASTSSVDAPPIEPPAESRDAAA